MPIDPSIIFRMEHARPAEYAMQGRTDRARLADYTSQVQARDFELGQRREEAGRAQSLRDLMGQYGQGGISRDDMVGQAYGIDPETARQFETHYAQLDEASRKRVRDMNDRAAALIATVSDQPSYEAALRQYAAEGGDVSEFPARYDPNHVDGLRRQVIGAKALMDQASKDRDYGLRSAEFSYRQQNDAANRGVQMRGQDITMRGQDIALREQAAGAEMKQAKLADRQQKLQAARAAGLSAIDDLVAAATEVNSAPGLDSYVGLSGLGLGNAAGGTLVSPVTGRRQAIPGSQSANAAALIDTLKAKIGFAELKAMRDASPTGGALGQITEKELNFLQNSINSLDPNQSPGQFRANVGKIIAHANRLRTIIYQEPTPGNPRGQAPGTPQGRASKAADLKAKYGLD